MYPLIFNNKEEHVKHIKQNKDFYKNILEHEDYEQMINKRIGETSNNKGKVFEYMIDLLLSHNIGDNYDIIRNNKTRRMDLRLKNKKEGYLIGIECKDKKVVTKKDIEKFKRDKVENKFIKNIFISTHRIPKILDKENSCKIIGDELYVFSDDYMFIAGIINCYVSSENSESSKVNIMIDKIINIYNIWKQTQQMHLELDKSLLDIIREIDDSLLNNHLYMITKNFCKKKY
tara:strand:- start:245 stop:937 length:693 start_codon:yes stop_codon:yes gene_type:complete